MLRKERPWPWGIVYVAATESIQPIPQHFGQELVVGNSSALACRIVHEVDGEGSFELWLGDATPESECVFDAPFDCPTGAVIVATAGFDDAELVVVEPQSFRARVYANERDHPTRVVLVLTPSAGGHAP